MEQSSFSATSRRNADRNLLNILLAGVGGSLAFHVAAIAGVAHFWKPVVAIDEPMEITMVDANTEPPVKPAPQPTVAPIVKAPPKAEPKPVAEKPVPIVKVPAKLEPKAPAEPLPIVKAASALDKLVDPVPTKTASKPAPKAIAPPPKAVAPPAFPDKLFKSPEPPAKTPIASKPKVAKSPTFTTPKPAQKIATDPQPETPVRENQSGLATNSPNRKLATSSTTDAPTPTQDEDFGQVKPSKVNPPAAEVAPSNNNQTGLTGNPANSSKLAGRLATNDATNNTPDDNFGQVAPSKIKTPTNDDLAGASGSNQSGLATKPTGGGKLGSRLTGNSPGSDSDGDRDFAGVAQGNSWRGARAEPGAGLKPSSDRGDDAGSGKAFGLQCISRCEISGLTDLEDRDGGKDKLRIKIAIDPQGNVTNASIAKSSGNSTIDRVVISGVKQMQFSPPGKIVERVVKANILL